MFKYLFNKYYKSCIKKIIRRKLKNINNDFHKSYYRKYKAFNLYDYC